MDKELVVHHLILFMLMSNVWPRLGPESVPVNHKQKRFNRVKLIKSSNQNFLAQKTDKNKIKAQNTPTDKSRSFLFGTNDRTD